MDSFPEEFSRTILYNKMERSQEKMIRDTRKKFYDDINESIAMCAKCVTLLFPDNMWNKYKVILLTEIINRFGEIRVCTDKATHGTTRLIDNAKDIPRHVNKIEIEFWSDGL